MKEPPIRIEDVLNGKYRYVEGQLVRRSYADMESRGIENVKYKIGDKVQIKSLDWYIENADDLGNINCNGIYFLRQQSDFCGRIMTIINADVINGNRIYGMDDDQDYYFWTDEMIECKVEKDVTRKEALTYIYNDDHMLKETLIEKIGEKYFNEFITMGFLTTNLGTRYWLTDLGRQYCLEIFN